LEVINRIRKIFYPDLYSKEVAPENGMKLCLVARRRIGRYCLAVFEYDKDQPVELQVKDARTCIRKATRSYWLFRELGAYIVFVSSEPIKGISSEHLSVDTTGFHAVILQGVHIIAPNTQIYNHSKWSNHTFGGAKVIAGKLSAVQT